MYLRLHHVVTLALLFELFVLSATEQSTIATNDDIRTSTQRQQKITKSTQKRVKSPKINKKLSEKSKSDVTTEDMTGINTKEVEYVLEGKLKLSDKNRFLVEYQVITCDGYIISIFRMKYRKTNLMRRNYPVLMFHGLLQSSDIFIQQGQNEAIAFKLQDLGYDVWLGNARGNKYSRLHLYLEPDLYGEKYRFFNYTFDEIGLYDIAATVDFILDETQKTRVHFIGNSHGGTAFLALHSLVPSSNSKFVAAHLLAPLGYQQYFPNQKLKTYTDVSDSVYEMVTGLGILEVFPYNNDSVPHTSIDDCLGNRKYKHICRELRIDRLMDLDENKINNKDTKGGAIKQIAHYAQNIKSKVFRRWNYGIEQNKIVYGTADPPAYNLSLIKTRTIIHYAEQDEFVNPKDILNMAKDLANGQAIKVKRKDFQHYDFLYAPDKMNSVYYKVIEDMNYWDVHIDDPMPDLRYKDASNRLSLSVLSYLIPLVILRLT